MKIQNAMASLLIVVAGYTILLLLFHMMPRVIVVIIVLFTRYLLKDIENLIEPKKLLRALDIF